jgi:hypothetical protein
MFFLHSYKGEEQYKRKIIAHLATKNITIIFVQITLCEIKIFTEQGQTVTDISTWVS